MHDRSTTPSPASWSEAFAALPTVEPPDRWTHVAARHGLRRRRTIGWLALAATLVVAVALPWKLQHETAPPPLSNVSTSPTHAPATNDERELAALYAQSAQLEALLAYARDDRVGSGSAEAVSARLDQRLVAIDAALAQPRLPAARQRDLWRERVATLRNLASFETNRRLLIARGERYDGALVRVD